MASGRRSETALYLKQLVAASFTVGSLQAKLELLRQISGNSVKTYLRNNRKTWKREVKETGRNDRDNTILRTGVPWQDIHPLHEGTVTCG